MSITTTRRARARARISTRPQAVALRATGRTPVERMLPLADLLLLQLIGCSGAGIALLLGGSGWWGAAAGLGFGLVVVVRLGGQSLPRWACARLCFWRDRRRRTAPSWTPFDYESPDGTAVGFCWDGRTLTSMIRVEGAPQSLTVLEPGGTVSGETVPVGVLADCLRQFDIALESIDVRTTGSRSAGHGHVSAVYDAVLGPLPAISERSVWVTVRLDPARCRSAIQARGGGWDGAMRTAAVATRRAADRLRDAGLSAGTATAADMAHAVADLSGGARLDTLTETWDACHSGPLRLRSFGIEPATCTSEGLAGLWRLPTASTAVTLSLRRDDERDTVEIRGIVRLATLGHGRTEPAGLQPLRGRQFDAFMCGLPLPTPRRAVGQWLTVDGDSGALADLTLPASGCGQVVGADAHGRAVALPLFGPRVARVELHGTLHLAQQVVLRSLALGARVRVHTRRTGAWRAMVEQVGDATRLQATGTDRGAIAPGAGWDPSVELYDGAPEQAVRSGVTAMVLSATHRPPSTAADVRLQLVDVDHDDVLVTTRTGSVTVTMVATDDEMRYIGASFDVIDDEDQPAGDWPDRQEQR